MGGQVGAPGRACARRGQRSPTRLPCGARCPGPHPAARPHPAPLARPAGPQDGCVAGRRTSPATSRPCTCRRRDKTWHKLSARSRAEGRRPAGERGSPVLGWGPARVLGVGVGRGHGEGGSQGCGDALSRWSRSTIRNAHSIHQRSRKRLSQDAYRRNSVRFLQQRRGLARPGPQSECGRGGAGTRAVGGTEGSGGGVGGRGRPEGGARGV